MASTNKFYISRLVSTDEEIEQKRLKMNAQKTIKQNIAAATLLREYLKEEKFVTLDFHIWLCLLSLFLGMILSNHRSSNKCNIVQ